MKSYLFWSDVFYGAKICSWLFVTLVQLLRGVTITAGGVLPNIHPELLSKKSGSKAKLEAVISPAPTKKSKTTNKAAVKRLGTNKSLRVKVFIKHLTLTRHTNPNTLY